MISGFLEWLGNTPWSIKLLESLWAWPLLESAHVLGITLFVGTTMMMDLRLMGVGFRGIRASDFTRRMLPWTRIGFAAMVVTGLLVFYSNPLRYYHNIFFRFKMVVLALAGLNVWLFHSRIHRRIGDWDLQDKPPRPARVAGAVSIVAWMLVVMFGRFIAYNWFDCDIQPQPEFVNWVSQCPAPPSAE